MSKKTTPKWGDIVHINDLPFVVLHVSTDGLIMKVADKAGELYDLLVERFDEYKPRTITINGIEVPEPVREPLRWNQKYWLAFITSGSPLKISWRGIEADHYLLENGFIHLSKENAQVHIDAVIWANKGETG